MSRTVTSQDTRIAELEAGRAQDKKKITHLETTLRDQLTERNNLLLGLWTRLSSICGSDWAHDNSLINGRALPSLESVGTMLPGFSKNLLAAVKTIETMVSGFQSRVKDVERELWREYETLQSGLDQRYKKLDRLEAIVRNGVATGSLNSHEHSKMARMEEKIRQLKVELATQQTARDVRSRAAYTSEGTLLPDGSGSPSPSIPTGPRDRERKSSSRRGGGRELAAPERPGALTRLSSSASAGSSHNPFDAAMAERNAAGSAQGEDKTWMLRLRDLEGKLKAEREGRTQDRAAARQRLGGLETENRDLKGEVSRMRRAHSHRD